MKTERQKLLERLSNALVELADVVREIQGHYRIRTKFQGVYLGFRRLTGAVWELVLWEHFPEDGRSHSAFKDLFEQAIRMAREKTEPAKG